MAPLRPTKRPSHPARRSAPLTTRARARPSTKPTSPTSTSASTFTTPSIPSTKRDKRTIKHSLLLSRLATSSSSAQKGVRKRLARTRKRTTAAASAKLSTNLADLFEALPSDDINQESGTGQAATMAASSAPAARQAALVAGGRSISAGRGLRRRREEVGKIERERFGRNMAAMALPASSAPAAQGQADGGGADVTGPAGDSSRADRWAALKRHIAASMQT